MINTNNNQYSMNYYVSETDFCAKGNFKSFDKETWNIGEKYIITPHGTLRINNAVFIDDGPLVGIEFSVKGKLKLNEFSCSTGKEKDVRIRTFALMRQPHNVWLWAYTFGIFGIPRVNFCGYEDLDGLAKLVSFFKRIY